MNNTMNALNQSPSHRAQLISRLIKKPSAGAIHKRNGEQIIPLSYAQEGLWMTSQLAPENPIYNVAGAVQFDGRLNGHALQQSLDEVIRRHEILRSRFADKAQQVSQAAQWPMTHLDLTCFVELQAVQSFQACAEDFILKPFRLSDQPPIRALFVRFGEMRHCLVLSLHHIVSDRWSVGILMREVATLYQAFTGGKPSRLAELPIQYGDFCIWQRQQPERWLKHLDYWKQKLLGAPSLLALPTDRPRPARPSYRGDVHAFELHPALNALCKKHNVTLFMLMAAAFSTLLYRYSGSKDIGIGYPVAGRSQSQAQDLIGFFVNTLVLRCKLDADMSFSELLLKIRAQALEDLTHQEVSFGQLLDALNPVRHASHTPLFQVMLTILNVPKPVFKLPDLTIKAMDLNHHSAQFDLTLLIDEQKDRLQACFEYNTDLFDAETIGRMAGHLQTLLKAAIDQPALCLKRLPLLTQAETQRLTDIGSGADVFYPEQGFVHSLFEAKALEMPDQKALVFGDSSMGYGELNRLSTLWSEKLLDLGAGPECRIGVCVARSIDMIVGLLAVLKAGAAYVPLDPDYPEKRLDDMLNDAGIGLLLTQSTLVERFKHRSIKTLCLDEALVVSGERPVRKPLSLDHTAYIIYTSGSSGRPKGVSISHRNLLHSTLARMSYYREPLECFLLLSSFAFDSSVAGIFWTLSQGACLCLPKQDELKNPGRLRRLIQQNKVTHLLALPSFYVALIHESLDSLKAVIVAGEACSAEIAAMHHVSLPKVQLYNEYGPTEGTVWSSVYRCKKTDAGMLPIGRAIDNVRIYILDDQYQPVPIGVGGELCIAGSGLARGYLNQPALTAEKFIPNPFSRQGGRLYKTGDLARFRADGEIEFLGRIDHQVKIRGYRIELEEIESRLMQHPDIHEACVLFKEGGLIAYWDSPTSAEALDNAALEAYLKQSLPDYMLPSSYARLDEWPSMPNGKRDRNALLNMKAPEQRAFKQASNWIESELQAIWQEVLGLDKVSADADFFELGGHSLAAIQVLSRIQSVFNLEIPAEILFEATTLSALAAELARLHKDSCLDDWLKEIEQLSEEEVDRLLEAGSS